MAPPSLRASLSLRDTGGLAPPLPLGPKVCCCWRWRWWWREEERRAAIESECSSFRESESFGFSGSRPRVVISSCVVGVIAGACAGGDKDVAGGRVKRGRACVCVQRTTTGAQLSLLFARVGGAKRHRRAKRRRPTPIETTLPSRGSARHAHKHTHRHTTEPPSSPLTHNGRARAPLARRCSRKRPPFTLPGVQKQLSSSSLPRGRETLPLATPSPAPRHVLGLPFTHVARARRVAPVSCKPETCETQNANTPKTSSSSSPPPPFATRPKRGRSFSLPQPKPPAAHAPASHRPERPARC